MDIFLLILRLLLASLFTVAALAKVADIRGSARAMAGFGVPASLSTLFSVSLVIAEILIAAFLLIPGYAFYGAAGAAFLLIIFTVSMAWHYFRGNDQDCHCFGQLVKEPVGLQSIIRNTVLLILSVFLVYRGFAGQGTELDTLTREDVVLVLLVLVAILLAIAVSSLFKVISDQKDMVRRLVDIESMAFENGAVHRENAGNPNDGLPIGAFFPNFSLADTNGEICTRSSLTAAGKPILAFFVSPTCIPCKSMLADFDDWFEKLCEKLTVVFISNGRPIENLEKFGGSVEKTILLQKDRELSDAAHTRWTPSAVLVAQDGRIASRTAAGDIAIRSLIAEIEANDIKSLPFLRSDNDGPDGKLGQKLPDFVDTDVDGRKLSGESLIGKPTLFVFWSSGCSFCRDLREEMIAWSRSASNGDPRLVVYSDSNAIEEFKGFEGLVVEDGSYDTARKLGMHGTPSAILVDKNGIIISEVAVGAPNIRAILDK